MPSEDRIAAAIETGRQKAEAILKSRADALTRRKAALEQNAKTLSFRAGMAAREIAGAPTLTLQTAGYLAALGDSWFDYPFHDVLKALEDDHGYNIESTAHKGDPIEKMAYQGGQIDGFARKLEKIQAHGAAPKAVLISGGGDDVAGTEFGMLLNNADSPIAGWNNDVVGGLVDPQERIYTAYVSMISSVWRTFVEYYPNHELHILVHGYDYPVPDGRGFFGGWPFPGPWLEPGFREKNFADLQTRIDMMREVMDRFNQLVAALRFPNVTIHYVDLRNTLSTALAGDAYKQWWANELHPTEKGFAAVANKFAAVLSGIP